MSAAFLSITLDHLGPLTVLYGAAAYIAYRIQPYISLFLSYALFVSLAYFYLHSVFYHFDQERRIRSRGKRAPSIHTWTPFNVGFLFQAVWYSRHHRNHEFWGKHLKRASKERPLTVETTALGTRIILTADEENIKAILATQFADYGKGPNFREEWKDFLGLSKYGTCMITARREGSVGRYIRSGAAWC